MREQLPLSGRRANRAAQHACFSCSYCRQAGLQPVKLLPYTSVSFAAFCVHVRIVACICVRLKLFCQPHREV